MSLFALLLLAGEPAAPMPGVALLRTQVMIRERLILRVPMRPQAAVARFRWKEGKGPKCVAMAQIAGASVTGREGVDIILRGGGRLRARFSGSCPALDFYTGFYILPTADRRICADRDAIRSRSGGECEIDRFRTLTPELIQTPREPR